MSRRQFLRLLAGHSSAVGKLEKCTDVIERETKLTTAANETEPMDVAFDECSMPSLGASGAWQQVDALVVSDRLDGDACQLRDVTY